MSVGDGVQAEPRNEPPQRDVVPAHPRSGRPWWHFLTEFPGLLFVVLAIAILIRTFLVAPFYIPSQSMENTLRVGDRVLVDRVSYHLHPIRRGDIVVFNGLDSFSPEVQTTPPSNVFERVGRSFASALGIAPPGEKDFIKRVIGVPGDHVVVDDGHHLSVNGVRLDESSYLFPGDASSLTTFDIRVPKGRLWVMGDHRTVSADSRSHTGDPGGGTVPSNKVIGRAFAVVYPFGHASGLGTPRTFDQGRLQADGTRGSYVLAASTLPLMLVGRTRRRWGRRL